MGAKRRRGGNREGIARAKLYPATEDLATRC
jgi:hypothetical protein